MERTVTQSPKLPLKIAQYSMYTVKNSDDGNIKMCFMHRYLWQFSTRSLCRILFNLTMQMVNQC